MLHPMHPRPPPQQIKNCLMLFSTLRCPSDHPVIRSAWNPDTGSPSHLGSLSLVAQRKRNTTSLYGVTVVGTNALFAPARRTKKRPSPSGCTYLKTSQPQQPSLCSRERLDEALDWRGLQTAAPGEPRRLAEIQWRRTLPSTHHPPPLLPRPRHHREPPRLPARPLSSDELSQRPETQDGHCRDAAAAGRRPGRVHSGKDGKHRRLADRCLSRGVATSTRSSSTRPTTRVHVPHGSPSGCRR